jgi:uncharacterized protein (DUF362 family)/NAD-dependent dihydropyrimidine dehydrogenase PreA subunit
LNKRSYPINDGSISAYLGVQSSIDVTHVIDDILDAHFQNHEVPQKAQILIKPNLNNDLSALTGNSTDLRVLTGLIKSLQVRGYQNIIIGDGPNVGAYRKGIDVFSRLGVKNLADYLNVDLVDLNQASSVDVDVKTGVVRITELCLSADFIINLPKIKTHAEAGMSGAVKNLMGCVVGTDTRVMHLDLAANLIKLNEIIKPDLIIVDGLFGMQGNGPGDGDPVRIDMLLVGTDPYLVDLGIARLVGLDYERISYLKIAQDLGRISQEDRKAVEQIEPVAIFAPPPPRSGLTEILEHPYLATVRDATRFIHGSELPRKVLFRLGIMQDVYEGSDSNLIRLELDREACDDCGKCLDICPTSLPITEPGYDFFASPDCISCNYCAFVCPQGAINIHGELGYLQAHLERYADAMRSL